MEVAQSLVLLLKGLEAEGVVDCCRRGRGTTHVVPR